MSLWWRQTEFGQQLKHWINFKILKTKYHKMCVFLSKEKNVISFHFSRVTFLSRLIMYSESCRIVKVFSIHCACDRTAIFSALQEFAFKIFTSVKQCFSSRVLKAKFLNNNYRERNCLYKKSIQLPQDAVVKENQ